MAKIPSIYLNRQAQMRAVRDRVMARQPIRRGGLNAAPPVYGSFNAGPNGMRFAITNQAPPVPWGLILLALGFVFLARR